MNFARTLTNPENATATFLVGVVIPLFCGLLVVAPPLAVTLAAVTIYRTCRGVKRRRQLRARLIAERKNTWGI